MVYNINKTNAHDEIESV